MPAEVQGRLDALWRQLPAVKEIAWQSIYTPLFASEWPPTPSTVWTRYAFAYGRDLTQPGLVDAQRVGRPWARIEYRDEGTTAAIIPLSVALDPLGIQGVRPLRFEEVTILTKSQPVFDYVLRLDALPNVADTSATDMRDYYRLWLSVNGVIAAEIKGGHRAFVDWLLLP